MPASLAALVACSSVDQGIPASTGGETSASDAGTATDAGSTPDSGPGTADAGPGGAVDAGTTAADCNGLTPETLGTMFNYYAPYDSQEGVCGEALGSGNGLIALLYSNSSHPGFAIIGTSGEFKSNGSLWRGSVWPQPGGFLALGGSSTSTSSVIRWSDNAVANPNNAQLEAGNPWLAVDFQGGLAIAGNIAARGSREPFPIQLMAANEDSSLRFGPRVLPLSTAVFGLGVDLNRRILVIQDGAPICGAGCIAAQWYQRDGNRATDPFKLIEGFQAGPATWFETAPLIGGGLAVRRMDARASGQRRGFTSSWLVTVESGSRSVHTAPAWMTSRNDTNLAVARGGVAYAVLSNGLDGQQCTQKLELVSPSGSSCASWDLAMTNDGKRCDNWDLRLGLDGTILQHLPAQLEQPLDSIARTKSCTVRFWPAALK